jgi:hypothetical protein
MGELLHAKFEAIPIGIRKPFMKACVDVFESMKIEDVQSRCPNCLEKVGTDIDEQHYCVEHRAYECKAKVESPVYLALQCPTSLSAQQKGKKLTIIETYK